jgi:hypothetical protein
MACRDGYPKAFRHSPILVESGNDTKPAYHHDGFFYAGDYLSPDLSPAFRRHPGSRFSISTGPTLLCQPSFKPDPILHPGTGARVEGDLVTGLDPVRGC